MREVTASVLVRGSLHDVWAFYFDPGRWAAWVDQFGSVESSQGYPEAAGTLVWHSTPSGRGKVTEQVLEHEPRRRHRISFVDPESRGELLTTFEIQGDAVEVTQRMSYELVHKGFLGSLTDVLFIRRQFAASLARSLDRLRREVESSERTS